MLIKNLLINPDHRSSIANYEEVHRLFINKEFPTKKDDLWRYFDFKILDESIDYIKTEEKTCFEFDHEIETISFGKSPFITKDKFELFNLLNSKEDKLLITDKDTVINYEIKSSFTTNMLKVIIPMNSNITIDLNIMTKLKKYFNIYNITFKVFGNLTLNLTSELTDGYSISYLNFIVNDNANVDLTIVENGNLFNKTIINSNQYNNSNLNIKYRSVLKNKENNDLVVLSQINKENCILDHDIKAVLYDNSTFSCYGVIDIMKSGNNASANHKQSTIAMSENVKINAVPVLKIDNGNVKCSHGAPSYYIKDADRFYLMSRGINKYNADKIILKSFLKLDNELLNKKIITILEDYNVL